ncbi:hypothetical protein PROFUN_16990 [Planoprotostelium fungivorum]|uniref:Uncharacterized protein n=1 Tax=Planoprotostelium fungivorum TaxID=1890364 RepID=A0A2P6MMP4_9EUKA|nr:hypothetical protein PROFUN_16990 [Planoprotostelium fungivorum]
MGSICDHKCIVYGSSDSSAERYCLSTPSIEAKSLLLFSFFVKRPKCDLENVAYNSCLLATTLRERRIYIPLFTEQELILLQVMPRSFKRKGRKSSTPPAKVACTPQSPERSNSKQVEEDSPSVPSSPTSESADREVASPIGGGEDNKRECYGWMISLLIVGQRIHEDGQFG